jgi:hypothetical protein
MSQVGLEPTTSVFERTTTVHAIDPAASVIGNDGFTYLFSTICISFGSTQWSVSASCTRPWGNCSNLGRVPEYPEVFYAFPQYFQTDAGAESRLGQERFFPNPL